MEQGHKKKNWQWRTIIWCSLFLIFGKSLGQWVYQALGIDQVYSATTNIVNRVGLNESFGATPPATLRSELIINVKNDTPNQYTVASKIISGDLEFAGQTFPVGETKRFTVKRIENTTTDGNSLGDILFTSEPVAGNNHSICQEVHVLNYDLKYANQIKQPLTINLSSINSKMDCKNSAHTPATK